jgi:hypothetical protein
MSNNFEILTQKFENFKNFIKEHSKSPKISAFDNYKPIQFLSYSAVLMKFKEDGKLQEIVDKTVAELEMDPIHKDKIMRYYLCFVEYLSLLTNDVKDLANKNTDDNKEKND